ncbi:DUF2946 family protein [Acinetobacter sp. HY1485]|uniref:DUF2946 family protein n=1 Tax=Acinetobacter sp. HY1485 TaxID=2970918 RepID=UPI0022B94594|nr:DUF2946 family protein [Acinetobacter sp. HY1485]
MIAFLAIFLQLAVFLQPLLPKPFQTSLVCETVSEVMHSPHHQMTMRHHHQSLPTHQKKKALEHECLYCHVYSSVAFYIEKSIQEVFERMQIRLLAFQHAFKHIYFALQRLFLNPQGRAPPIS